METILLTPPEDWPAFQVHEHSSILQVQRLDYQTFRKMADKNNFPLRRLGNFKLLDVEQAMAMVRHEAELAE